MKIRNLTVIRLERLQLGSTLRAFAREWNRAEGTLSRIEFGRQYVPPAWRCRLATAFGLTETEICDEVGLPRFVGHQRAARQHREKQRG